MLSVGAGWRSLLGRCSRRWCGGISVRRAPCICGGCCWTADASRCSRWLSALGRTTSSSSSSSPPPPGPPMRYEPGWHGGPCGWSVLRSGWWTTPDFPRTASPRPVWPGSTPARWARSATARSESVSTPPPTPPLVPCPGDCSCPRAGMCPRRSAAGTAVASPTTNTTAPSGSLPWRCSMNLPEPA